jgi:hypothetical protein
MPVLQTLKVITHAAFHPRDPNLLAWSTSRTVLSMSDLRQKDVAGEHALELGRGRQHVCLLCWARLCAAQLPMADEYMSKHVCTALNISPCRRVLIHRTAYGVQARTRNTQLSHANLVALRVQNAQSPFFSELVEAASSFQFSPDGRYVATRDYMRGSIWDARKADAPLRTFEAHEHLWEHLMEVYQNESIFDRLGCAVSPAGDHLALGSYCELGVYSLHSDTFTQLRSCGSPAVHNVRGPS